MNPNESYIQNRPIYNHLTEDQINLLNYTERYNPDIHFLYINCLDYLSIIYLDDTSFADRAITRQQYHNSYSMLNDFARLGDPNAIEIGEVLINIKHSLEDEQC